MACLLVGNSLSKLIRAVYGSEIAYVAVNGLNLIVAAIPSPFQMQVYTTGYDTCGAVCMGGQWLVFPNYREFDFAPLFN